MQRVLLKQCTKLEGRKCRRKRKLAIFKVLNDTQRVRGRVCVRSQGKEGVAADGSGRRQENVQVLVMYVFALNCDG